MGDGEKVERDEKASPLEARNAVWDGRTVSLFGARNEIVAFQVIVVADSTKFGHTSLAQMCPLEEIDVLVTDNELAAEWPQRLAAAGVKLVIAETEINGRPEARPT